MMRKAMFRSLVHTDTILNSPLFQSLSQSELSSILHCLEAQTQVYKKNQYILRYGDTTSWLGLVLSGSVHIEQGDYWGNRHIITHLGKSQIFGEAFACASNCKLSVSIIADQDSEILKLNTKRILNTCPAACSHHRQIIQNLVLDLAKKNLSFIKKITMLTQRSTQDKVLNYLSTTALETGSSSFEIPYNRQELADFLAVDRSALSSVLSKLKTLGLIDYQKNNFTLHSHISNESD